MPVWVALFTLIGTAITAGSIILKERVGRKTPAAKTTSTADVAIATLDNRAMDALRAVLESGNAVASERNSELRRANEIADEGNIQIRRLIECLRELTGEVEELRRELREHGNALRRE